MPFCVPCPHHHAPRFCSPTHCLGSLFCLCVSGEEGGLALFSRLCEKKEKKVVSISKKGFSIFIFFYSFFVVVNSPSLLEAPTSTSGGALLLEPRHALLGSSSGSSRSSRNRSSRSSSTRVLFSFADAAGEGRGRDGRQRDRLLLPLLRFFFLSCLLHRRRRRRLLLLQDRLGLGRGPQEPLAEAA